MPCTLRPASLNLVIRSCGTFRDQVTADSKSFAKGHGAYMGRQNSLKSCIHLCTLYGVSNGFLNRIGEQNFNSLFTLPVPES